MIQWKEATRHFWFGRRLAREQEGRLKRRLHDEQVKRAALVNTLSDLLMDIAYDDDDPEQTFCNVCHRSLIEEDGHQSGCLYVVGLTVLVEAGRHGD